MTLGSAAARGRPGARLRRPGGATRASRAPRRRRSRWKWVKVWRTSPRSRQSAAKGGARLRRGLAPRSAGQAEHAAEQARGRAGLDQHGPVVAQREPGGAVPDGLRRLLRPARQLGGDAGAGARHRREPAGRCRRRARAGCRRWRRGPSPPGRSRRAAPPASAPRRARAARGFAAGSGASTARSRAITRSTLPSTTTAGRSKAIAAIAAAV